MFDLLPPSDDGLLIPEVQRWSAAKHYFLRRFIDGFTTAMRNKWPELHYVDLFAGSGIERVEGLGLDWGSPLIAAQAPHKFYRLHLCELDAAKFRALDQRVSRFQQPEPAQLLLGDANKRVGEIIHALPKGCLSLAFLDPYGLHLHYKSIQQIATRKTDLIVFFPDHLDALRNWEKYYKGNLDSNLDLVLGTTQWRTRKAETPPNRWVDVLREIYESQLRLLGYTEFEYERIRGTNRRPLYRLIFCSRDKTGGKIWRGISQQSPDGQGKFQW